jgi:2-succinyl-5-enolpyruvyl-6-hydroxy-3-cyclohexene-1-carboxylate synthase
MKPGEAPNLNYAWAGLMVEELVRNGVTCFCIAPGSRSAPLTAAAAGHPEVKTVVHYDERGLAYFALGYVSVTGHPAVLICTSGTAAANFFPAVVETSKKKLPLILLTADRPPELQDTGALQTIDQVKIYGNYVRWYTNLTAPDIHIKPEVLLTTIDQAVFRSKDPLAGPVHINCQFREPLAPDKTDFDAAAYLGSVHDWLNNGQVYTRYTAGGYRSDLSGDRELVSILNRTKRGIIVVGKLSSGEEQEAVLRLSEKLNWPVFPDIVSGLRMREGQNIIHYYDQVLLSDALLKHFPVDTVLHLGGRITSKRWYQYIEKQRPANYIMVLGHPLRNDPLHIVSIRVRAKIRDFAESVLPVVESNAKDDYLCFLQGASQRVGGMIDDFTAGFTGVNEIGAARVISGLMPGGHGLFLSNSMPVREMDMYAVPTGKWAVVGGNRGASGIDGTLAGACGFAQALNAATTLLTGDLAFLHDLNSLALVKTLKKPLIIIVLNNDGGGIFSFLPIADSPGAADIFDRYFGTPHGLEFSNAARMFGLDYAAPKTIKEFAGIYQKALESERSLIIEIKTRREENYKLHRDLQEKIKTKIDKMI